MSKLKKYQMYIDGQWVDAENNKTFETLNPENNEPWAIVPEASALASGTIAQGSLFSGFKVSNVLLFSASTH